MAVDIYLRPGEASAADVRLRDTTVADGNNVGTAAVLLDAVAGVAAGHSLVSGSASVALAAVSGAATGTVRVSGASTVALAAVTGLATGTVRIVGVVVATVAPVTGSASGEAASATIMARYHHYYAGL